MPTLPVDRYTSRYDEDFQKYTKRWFGLTVHWKWFKSQGVAESALKPTAKSWVGAMGIMQVMPATWKEIQTRNPEFVDPYNPSHSIGAGIYYDSLQWKAWNNIPNSNQRLAFMFASYNAGRGHILNAYKLCKCTTWPELIKYAPQVTKWRSSETIGYVNRIFSLMNQKP